MKIYIKSAISPDQDRFTNSKIGIAYKVFKVKDGKLYPPKVANTGNVDTPIGVWLDAEEGEFAGLNKEGRPTVKSTDGSALAYRPGWHLGDLPKGIQFNVEPTWELVDKLPRGAKVADKSATSLSTLSKSAIRKNYGKYVYVKSIDKYAHIQGTPKLKIHFPRNFIWAKCAYIMDVDYQEEAHNAGITEVWVNYKLLPDTEVDADGNIYHLLQFSQGKNIFNITFADSNNIHIDGYPFESLMADYDNKNYAQKEVQDYFLSDNYELIKSIISNGSAKGREKMSKFVYRYGDIKHLPTDGYYKYKTNPDPATVPWIISGSIKVLKLLGDSEVDAILRSEGLEPIPRSGGPMEVEDILQEYG
jgi:hypothetical protein